MFLFLYLNVSSSVVLNNVDNEAKLSNIGIFLIIKLQRFCWFSSLIKFVLFIAISLIWILFRLWITSNLVRFSRSIFGDLAIRKKCFSSQWKYCKQFMLNPTPFEIHDKLLWSLNCSSHSHIRQRNTNKNAPNVQRKRGTKSIRCHITFCFYDTIKV